jgi:hypothetical protein
VADNSLIHFVFNLQLFLVTRNIARTRIFLFIETRKYESTKIIEFGSMSPQEKT